MSLSLAQGASSLEWNVLQDDFPTRVTTVLKYSRYTPQWHPLSQAFLEEELTLEVLHILGAVESPNTQGSRLTIHSSLSSAGSSTAIADKNARLTQQRNTMLHEGSPLNLTGNLSASTSNRRQRGAPSQDNRCYENYAGNELNQSSYGHCTAPLPIDPAIIGASSTEPHTHNSGSFANDRCDVAGSSQAQSSLYERGTFGKNHGGEGLMNHHVTSQTLWGEASNDAHATDNSMGKTAIDAHMSYNSLDDDEDEERRTHADVGHEHEDEDKEEEVGKGKAKAETKSKATKKGNGMCKTKDEENYEDDNGNHFTALKAMF